MTHRYFDMPALVASRSVLPEILPTTESWAAPPAPDAVPAPMPAVPARPVRFLIVDDAASTRHLLRAVLEHCPQFAVAGEADNGVIAVERAVMLQPDVILLDLSMPVADGSSVLGQLLRAAPNARVIVLSSTDPACAAPLLAAGASAFLPKGLYPFDLIERLGRILGRGVTLQPEGPADVPDEMADDVAVDAPVDEAPEVASHEPIADTAPTPPSVRPRAVICDDDPMVRRLVAELLASSDVDVIAETSVVPNLLTVVDLSQPELVVLDLWLEGITGTSALPEIHRISPRTLVFVYSAYEEWSDKAMAGGAAAFVAKPNFHLLDEAIRRLAPRSVPTAVSVP
ncbi:MAG: DNA-binding response regulator [Acidimicrobiales bacterium]|nr:DNA-binding response regulator [Acidimicrobiales bacterium]